MLEGDHYPIADAPGRAFICKKKVAIYLAEDGVPIWAERLKTRE
jgi:hypothetical protein